MRHYNEDTLSYVTLDVLTGPPQWTTISSHYLFNLLRLLRPRATPRSLIFSPVYFLVADNVRKMAKILTTFFIFIVYRLPMYSRCRVMNTWSMTRVAVGSVALADRQYRIFGLEGTIVVHSAPEES